MKKKRITVLIAAVIAAVLAAGCSGRNQGSTGTGAQGSFDANGYWNGETAELTMVGLGDTSAYNKRLDTRTLKELEKRTGVRMSYEGIEDQKFQIVLNSGDLKDVINNSVDMAMASTGHYYALDDLIAKWGKDMMDTMGWAVDLGNNHEDGKIYTIPTANGVQLRQDYPTWIRWDWFKEIGAPDIRTWRDYFDALRKIQDNHPRTENGYPVYGMASFNDWNWEYAWAPTWQQILGYARITHGTWTSLSGDRKLHYIWDDEPGNPFFECVLMMATAKWMGILDPDSFIQNYEEMTAKRDRGQYISMFSDYVTRSWNITHGSLGSAYEPLPWKGGQAYVNGYANLISATGFGFGIPKTSSDPDAAMRWINFVCSYDGAELLYNGVQGIDWVIGSNGKPTLTDSFIADRNNGVGPDVTGFPHGPSMIGLSSLVIDPRYDMTVQWTQDVAIAALSNTRTDQDFSDHFGVVSPHDAIKQAVARGDMIGDGNFPAMATRVESGMEVPVNVALSIAQTGTQILELMDTQAALLFNTNNEREFNAVRQQVIARFRQLDVDAYVAYQNDVWQRKLERAGY
jgi:hypothetical protein